jgi:hypothetical protein
MDKILFIAPHLSTGGLPQYLFKKIEELYLSYEIHLIEYEDVTGNVLVVQKNKIKTLLGENLHTIPWGGDKSVIIDIINKIKPNIIHLEEMPEYFMSDDIAKQIYTNDRAYKIFETSHDSSFDVNNKRFIPDKFILVSKYQIKMLSGLGVPCEVVEYPIEYKERPNRDEALQKLGLDPSYKHVLHVGLFTPRKNQSEFFEYAASLIGEKIQFHSVGNLADNFKYYWEDLVKNKPENVIIHGERSDVDNFYSAMDLFLFTSKGTINDKETMPLVIREAISWNLPVLIYNLPVYENYFDGFKNVSYLNFNDFEYNKNLVKSKLVEDEPIIIISTYTNTEHIIKITKDSVSKIKEYGYKVILTSHHAIPIELQNIVDYSIVDQNNIITHHDFYSNAWQDNEDISMQMNITTEGNHLYHGAAVYTNYYNGISLAKNVGYKKAICFNYDMVISDETVIKTLSNYLNANSAVYNHFKASEGESLRTVIFATNTDFFLNNFRIIQNEDDYIKWQNDIKSESNGLENMFYNTLKDKLQLIKTINNNEYNELLKNCNVDICSMVEYFNILPVSGFDKTFAIWLSTSNIVDDRRFDVNVYKNHKLISNNTINVKTAQYWYKSFIFEPGSEYLIDLCENYSLKKQIKLDDNYFNNKLKENGLLHIKK